MEEEEERTMAEHESGETEMHGFIFTFHQWLPPRGQTLKRQSTSTTYHTHTNTNTNSYHACVSVCGCVFRHQSVLQKNPTFLASQRTLLKGFQRQAFVEN